MGDFKKLRAWREVREFVLLSNRAIKKLPVHEKYMLADQWRRAAYSVPLNIAEGTGRLEYLPTEEIAQLKQKRADCARMVFGLIRRFG